MHSATLAPVVNGTAFPRPMDGQLGDAGAFRTGFLLMADEARRIEEGIKELVNEVKGLALGQATMTGSLNALIKDQDDHEKRIRSLESGLDTRAPVGMKQDVDSLRQWRAQVIGGAFALSLLTSGTTAWIVNAIIEGAAK